MKRSTSAERDRPTSSARPGDGAWVARASVQQRDDDERSKKEVRSMKEELLIRFGPSTAAAERSCRRYGAADTRFTFREFNGGHQVAAEVAQEAMKWGGERKVRSTKQKCVVLLLVTCYLLLVTQSVSGARLCEWATTAHPQLGPRILGTGVTEFTAAGPPCDRRAL